MQREEAREKVVNDLGNIVPNCLEEMRIGVSDSF